MNPIAVFVYSLLFALFGIEMVGKDLQPIAIGGVAVAYVLISIAVAVWREKVSAREIQAEYRELKRRVSELEVLEKEVPKVMVYTFVEKHLRLKEENGNAHFSMAYHGKNISKSNLNRVRHFISTEEKIEEDQLSNVKFNNEDITPQIEHVQYIKNGKTSWRNDIYFETSEPVLSDRQLNTSYEAELKKEYVDAFKDGWAVTLHEVTVRTDRFLVDIVAPEGYYFKNPIIDVRDMFSNIEIHNEKNRISIECPPVAKHNRKKIVWDVLNPRISYRYSLLFKLEKRRNQPLVPSAE